MEKYLYKESYQLKNFSKIAYKSLWGAQGIFTTIRIFGNSKKLILIEAHIKQFNKSLKKLNINFKISEKFLINIIKKNIKLKKCDHLLRVACNKKILSLSIRKRTFISKKFFIQLKNYQRPLAQYKNLKYKKILKLQKNINLKKEELVFFHNNFLLEGSTSNIIAVKNNTLYVPIGFYYFGVTIRYLLNKSNLKTIRKKISINNLENYSEILLVGSGKEVVSVYAIKNKKWKRTSVKIYKKLINDYNKLLI